MVDKLINTPVLDSMLSQINSRSRCTRLEQLENPALAQSSAMHIFTHSCSVVTLVSILNIFERLLIVKLKVSKDILSRQRHRSDGLRLTYSPIHPVSSSNQST